METLIIRIGYLLLRAKVLETFQLCWSVNCRTRLSTDLVRLQLLIDASIETGATNYSHYALTFYDFKNVCFITNSLKKSCFDNLVINGDLLGGGKSQQYMPQSK